MKEFKIAEFVNIVKNYKQTVKYNTSDAQVKYMFCQLVKDNGFDCADVLCFLYEAWEKIYPAFARIFNDRKWDKVIMHYIKEAEASYNWDLAEKYQNVLESVSSTGKEREEELKTKFFSLISELGYDPILMEMDMTLDLWGWMRTLDLVLSMVEKEESCDEAVVIEKEEDKIGIDTSATEVIHVKEISPVPVEKPTETTVDKKVKKTRKRVKYLEIQQYSLEGELIGRFKSIMEAAKSGNYNHASISKNVNGVYKTAEGYKWVGITQQLENTEESELAA